MRNTYPYATGNKILDDPDAALEACPAHPVDRNGSDRTRRGVGKTKRPRRAKRVDERAVRRLTLFAKRIKFDATVPGTPLVGSHHALIERCAVHVALKVRAYEFEAIVPSNSSSSCGASP